MLKNIKNWPDKKKRTFSIAVAIIATLILAGSWFFLKSKISYFNEKNPSDNKAINDLKDSFLKISNQFNEMKGQIFGTSSTSTEESTSTGSSTNNFGTRSATNTI